MTNRLVKKLKQTEGMHKYAKYICQEMIETIDFEIEEYNLTGEMLAYSEGEKSVYKFILNTLNLVN